MLLQIVQEILTNYTKVIAGMVAATMCIAVLGVMFLPSFGHPVDDTARLFVFTMLGYVASSVGINGAVARTLGVLK